MNAASRYSLTLLAALSVTSLAGCSHPHDGEDMPVHDRPTFSMQKTLTLDVNPETPDHVLEHMKINGQPVEVTSVHKTQLTGPLYEVRLKSGEVVYSDAQGRRMILGTYYDNAPAGLRNLTEEGGRQARLDALAKVPDNAKIEYAAKGQEKGHITVFTDSTCPYCQALHRELPQLQAQGVRVTYIPFPRAGADSPAARQLAQVLCSDKPGEAMTNAFNNGALSAKPSASCQTAVRHGHELGMTFGVKGTPTIVLPSGEQGEGYMPADQLVRAATQSSPSVGDTQP
ncbi:DsbC family protein [Carnimonas bestiolae]|uniref:DsbC family protein n=1 Tax=Carnimonas bestiolae TaxID=3402172 RepID=UPI003EDB782F